MYKAVKVIGLRCFIHVHSTAYVSSSRADTELLVHGLVIMVAVHLMNLECLALILLRVDPSSGENMYARDNRASQPSILDGVFR